MTMRNRSRMMTPRKRRLWTQQSGDISLAAALVNTASQGTINLGAEFLTQSGLATLNGVTLARVYAKGLITEADASTPTLFTVGFGVQQVPLDAAATSLPSVMQHQGKPLLSWLSRVLEGTSSRTSGILEPFQAQLLEAESKAQRKIEGTDYGISLVAAKDGATEQIVIVSLAVTCLWLY